MKFPKIDNFAREKEKEMKFLEEDFKTNERLFYESTRRIIEDQKVQSPMFPLLLEKFVDINPGTWDHCMSDIFSQFDKYPTND